MPKRLIDISSYSLKGKELPEKISKEMLSTAREVGYVSDTSCRAGSFFQSDHEVLLASVAQEGLEIMNIEEALEKHRWLGEYWWNLISPEKDEYTRFANEHPTRGYFMRAQPGMRVEVPIQACMYMGTEGIAQNVHNVIIAEEGSELHVITGCATAPKVRGGLHIGITEFYVKKNATLSFTMIHNWAEDMVVRPRSVAQVDEGGVFLSNYFCMRPVRTLQMYPTALCKGRGSIARFNSVLVSHEGTELDVGSRVELLAPESRAEVISRAVAKGGKITARGYLAGIAPDVKGHLECRGLILSETGEIHAVPELVGSRPDIDLSHEAAVGKIAEEEIRYLMSRGLTAEEATAAIVRGFLDVEIKGLPEQFQESIKTAINPDGKSH
ncbi:SufD family Fe-S cluster assembly protein [Nitrospirota bacterium]